MARLAGVGYGLLCIAATDQRPALFTMRQSRSTRVSWAFVDVILKRALRLP
jgi:hypothetical protein